MNEIERAERIRDQYFHNKQKGYNCNSQKFKIDVSHNFDNRNYLLIMKKRITVILNSLIIILLFKSFLKTSVLNPSVLIPNSGFSIVDNKVYFSALIDQGKKIVSLT